MPRIKAASLGGNRSIPSKAPRMPKLLRKAMSVSLCKNISSSHIIRPMSAMGTGLPMTLARFPASVLRKCSPLGVSVRSPPSRHQT